LIITGKKIMRNGNALWKSQVNFSFDIDSYEQQIERPTDYKVEKKDYSGKQEKYCLEEQNNCDAF
jgi:hypothetical protein